jgi:hypothetical protein
VGIFGSIGSFIGKVAKGAVSIVSPVAKAVVGVAVPLVGSALGIVKSGGTSASVQKFQADIASAQKTAADTVSRIASLLNTTAAKAGAASVENKAQAAGFPIGLGIALAGAAVALVWLGRSK